MKNVLYLHGLDSEQGGEKVSVLSSKYLVHAPSIDYRHPDVYEKIFKIYKHVFPDIIVGSSMGGYLASLIAWNSYMGPELILINPALHSRTEEPNLPTPLKYKNFDKQTHSEWTIGNVILGMDDEIIPAQKTFDMFDGSKKMNITCLPDVGHRVNGETFRKVLSEIGYL